MRATNAAADSATGTNPGPASAWRNDTLVVAAALFAWFAATAWMRPLTLPDEGRYVGVAWEMLRSGDWLTPTLDGLPPRSASMSPSNSPALA